MISGEQVTPVDPAVTQAAQAIEAARQRAAAERKAAREAGVLVEASHGQPGAPGPREASALPAASPASLPTADANGQSGELRFADLGAVMLTADAAFEDVAVVLWRERLHCRPLHLISAQTLARRRWMSALGRSRSSPRGSLGAPFGNGLAIQNGGPAPRLVKVSGDIPSRSPIRPERRISTVHRDLAASLRPRFRGSELRQEGH